MWHSRAQKDENSILLILEEAQSGSRWTALGEISFPDGPFDVRHGYQRCHVVLSELVSARKHYIVCMHPIFDVDNFAQHTDSKNYPILVFWGVRGTRTSEQR